MLVEDLDGEDREVGLAEGLVIVPLVGGAAFLLGADIALKATNYSNSPQNLVSDSIPDASAVSIVTRFSVITERPVWYLYCSCRIDIDVELSSNNNDWGTYSAIYVGRPSGHQGL